VQLAISDAHPGLKAALGQVLGAAWQRCTVHLLRDCLGHPRRDQHGLLGALIRPIFNAASLAETRDRLSEAVAHLEGSLSKVATLLEDAEPDILAFYSFPADHWRKLRSTDESVKGRTPICWVFSGDRSVAVVPRRAGDRLLWAGLAPAAPGSADFWVGRPSSAKRRAQRWSCGRR
jgi:transposase-like protein